jgi:8-oxo-dGTP diphosphatase
VEKNSTILVVAAALAGPDGRYLLQQRPPGRAMEGLWEFPGGKVEAGEGFEAALARELAEELGIGVDAGDLHPLTFATTQAGDAPLLLLLYVCRAWRGAPRPLAASALVWASPDEMAQLPMPPADAPFIEVLRGRA